MHLLSSESPERVGLRRAGMLDPGKPSRDTEPCERPERLRAGRERTLQEHPFLQYPGFTRPEDEQPLLKSESVPDTAWIAAGGITDAIALIVLCDRDAVAKCLSSPLCDRTSVRCARIPRSAIALSWSAKQERLVCTIDLAQVCHCWPIKNKTFLNLELLLGTYRAAYRGAR